MTDQEIVDRFTGRHLPSFMDMCDHNLKRVLWLAASGKFYLPQNIGEDIDEMIKQNAIDGERARLDFLAECAL